MEYDIFSYLREYIEGFINQLQTTSEAIATLDVLCSFAHVSERYGYVTVSYTHLLICPFFLQGFLQQKL